MNFLAAFAFAYGAIAVGFLLHASWRVLTPSQSRVHLVLDGKPIAPPVVQGLRGHATRALVTFVVVLTYSLAWLPIQLALTLVSDLTKKKD